MVPVAKCRLINALFLALPAVDWLSPMHHSDKKLLEVPTHCAHRRNCSTLIPHSCVTICGV